MQASGYRPQAPTASRRGPGQMMQRQPDAGLAPRELQAREQLEEQQARRTAEMQTRKSQKPVDRNLPDGLEDVVIGDGVHMYRDLQSAEKKLDAIMMRKRLDVSDRVQQHDKAYGTMRIWISNTVEDQPWQAGGMDPNAFDFSTNVEARYRMKIEGRLLEDGEEGELGETGEDGGAQTKREEVEPAAKRPRLSLAAGARKKFSHFFKAIAVEFDRPSSLQPDQYNQIDWKRPSYEPGSPYDPPKGADFDCLEMERKLDENVAVTIKLVREESPERYKLQDELAELLDMQEADRQTMLMGIWEYVKMNNLQDEVDKRVVRCDDKLRKLFNCDSFVFPHLSEKLRHLAYDLLPVSLPYTIRVDKAFHADGVWKPTIYDVRVQVDNPLQAAQLAITQGSKHVDGLRQIAAFDDQLALHVEAVRQSKAKHDFFTSLSTDPANFIKRWVSSQKRDLDVMMGAGAWGDEDWQGAEWRKGGSDGPWGSTEAWEGVGSYLAKQKA